MKIGQKDRVAPILDHLVGQASVFFEDELAGCR